MLRSARNYNKAEASKEAGLDTGDETRTIQSAKDEADINVIVRRFGVTGHLPTSIRMPTYGDFENAGDFRTAMEVVLKAKEAFQELPSSLRRRFGHDPQAFLEFCSDPRNGDELVKMGLADLRKDDTMASGESVYNRKEKDDGKQRVRETDGRRSSARGKANRAVSDDESGDGSGVE